MQKDLRKKLKSEMIWLIGVGVLAAVTEYVLILVLDLHPMFSLLMQGIIGLMVIGYLIRMIARVWNTPETNYGR